MACARYCDTGAEIQINVAVDILDGCALAARHHERRASRVRWGNDCAIALDDSARPRTRRRNLDVWNAHLSTRDDESTRLRALSLLKEILVPSYARTLVFSIVCPCQNPF